MAVRFPMARYVAIVDGSPGAYGVVVPDLAGCTSGGATIDEALRNAVEAVTLWVEDARADGEKIPKPRPAEKLRSDPDVATAIADGGVLAYVPLVLNAARPLKANLSLDAGLLSAIDEGGGAPGSDTLGFSRERGTREDRKRWVSSLVRFRVIVACPGVTAPANPLS